MIWLLVPLICLLVWWYSDVNELWIGVAFAAPLVQHLI